METKLFEGKTQTLCNGFGTYILRNGTSIKGTWENSILKKASDPKQKFYVNAKTMKCILPHFPMNIVNTVSPATLELGKLFGSTELPKKA
jgi:hypothetical protein